MLVNIDEDTMLNLLMDRLKEYWGDNLTQDEINLFEKMYRNLVESGVFENQDFDVSLIVDNDYVNYCTIVDKNHEMYEQAVEAYKEQDGAGAYIKERKVTIEEVDNEDDPTMFLVRYSG